MIARPIPFGLLLLGLAGCGKLADSVFCASAGCDWKPGEWERIAALANPDDPPPDLSNDWRDDPTAVALGQDVLLRSGRSRARRPRRTPSSAIRRPRAPPRTRAIGISCATCHDLRTGGVDTTSVPGHVSVGAGWTDVNALPVVNSAYRQVVFWNGRADSLWALNAVVAGELDDAERQPPAHRASDLRPLRPQPIHESDRKQLSLLGSLDARHRALREHRGMPGRRQTERDAGLPGGRSERRVRLSAERGPADAGDPSCSSTGRRRSPLTSTQLISVDSQFDRFVTRGP